MIQSKAKNGARDCLTQLLTNPHLFSLLTTPQQPLLLTMGAPYIDPSIFAKMELREGDVFVSTGAKQGTTWTMCIFLFRYTTNCCCCVVAAVLYTINSVVVWWLLDIVQQLISGGDDTFEYLDQVCAHIAAPVAVYYDYYATTLTKQQRMHILISW